jgi:hypothetical protein
MKIPDTAPQIAPPAPSFPRRSLLSKIVLGIIFYLVVTPVALIIRLSGYDLLKRKYDPKAASYWIDRAPPGPGPNSFRNQL